MRCADTHTTWAWMSEGRTDEQLVCSCGSCALLAVGVGVGGGLPLRGWSKPAFATAGDSVRRWIFARRVTDHMARVGFGMSSGFNAAVVCCCSFPGLAAAVSYRRSGRFLRPDACLRTGRCALSPIQRRPHTPCNPDIARTGSGECCHVRHTSPESTGLVRYVSVGDSKRKHRIAA